MDVQWWPVLLQREGRVLLPASWKGSSLGSAAGALRGCFSAASSQAVVLLQGRSTAQLLGLRMGYKAWLAYLVCGAALLCVALMHGLGCVYGA